MPEWLVQFSDALFTDNAFWTMLSIFLGALISIYATLIFARSTRFSETIRELEMNRQHFDGYPISRNDLKRSLPKVIDFYHMVEKIEWRLNADGHYRAAGEVSRLRQFLYWVAAKIENMQSKGSELSSTELYHFQLVYNKVHERERFVKFGSTLRPSLWALLRPFPHSTLPTKSITKMIKIE